MAYRCGVSLELTSSALWERTLRRCTHIKIEMHSHTLHLMENHIIFCVFFNMFVFCVLPSGIVLMVPRRSLLKSALW